MGGYRISRSTSGSSRMFKPEPHPTRSRGKGAIFSRWETRDLSLARFAEADGWAQSSGHEGDFIGVRRLYPWGTGDYTARLAPEEHLPDGVWYGVWVTDLSTEITTWIGSLWVSTGRDHEHHLLDAGDLRRTHRPYRHPHDARQHETAIGRRGDGSMGRRRVFRG